MKNKISVWIVIIFLLLLFFPIQNIFADSPINWEWTIENDTVYINNSMAYLSATPHTLADDGWVEFELESKQLSSSSIDVGFGFNSTEAKPKKIEIWRNYTHNMTGHRWIEQYMNMTLWMTAGENLGMENYGNYDVDVGNENNTYLWNISYKFYEDMDDEWYNSSLIIAFESKTPPGMIPDINYTFFYYDEAWETYYYDSTFWDWKPFNFDYNVVNYGFRDADTWYLFRDISIQEDVRYKIRGWIDIPFGGLEGNNGKYWWVMKPHAKTIAQSIADGHLLYLDPWWDTDWDYYKTIEVADKIDDYQMKILIDFDSDVGGNVSCEGHCQADFDDIRFVYDNSTELPYWIENYTASTQATFWVNNSGNYSSFEMFYGNDAVGNTSDGDATFIYFDDFSGDESKWTDVSDGWTVTGGEYTSSIMPSAITYFTGSSITDMIIEGDFKHGTTVESAYSGLAFRRQSNSEYYFAFMRTHNEIAASRIIGVYYYDGGYTSCGMYGNDLIQVNTWYHFRIDVYGSTGSFYLGTGKGTGGVAYQYDADLSTHITSAGEVGIATLDIDYNVWVDNFWVRKYASPEPSWSSFGSEQSQVGWSNSNPVASSPNPPDTQMGVKQSLTNYYNHFNITITDVDNANQSVNITWRTNGGGTWQNMGYNESTEMNATFYCMNVSWIDSYNTTYYWSVNVSDNHSTKGWDNETYSFSTGGITISNEQPTNGSTGISLTPWLNITVGHMDDDNGVDMNVTFRTNATGSWGDIGTNSSVNNGTYRWTNNSMDSHNTKYWWSVNVSDGHETWSNHIYSFTTSIDNPPFTLPNDASYETSIKVHNGKTYSDEVGHVDILYFPNGWGNVNGSTYKYWLVASGYENEDEDTEQSCILVSNNISNDSWTEPANNYYTTNPIHGWSWDDGNYVGGHFSDPCLVYNNDTNEIWMYDRNKSRNDDFERIELYKTSDGVNWTKISHNLNMSKPAGGRLMSPSVVKEGDNWYMWIINGSTSPNIIEYYTSTNGTWWTFHSSLGYSMRHDESWNLWHMKIIKYNNEYWGFVSERLGNVLDLYYIISTDRINWNGYASPILPRGSGGSWDDYRIYMAALVIQDGDLKGIYNGDDGSANFHAGYTFNTTVGGSGSSSNVITDIKPTQSGESPVNASTDISVTPSLYVICTDADSDTMTATWRSNSSGAWVDFATNSSISTGTNITQDNSNFSAYSTTYWWSVNLSDGTDWCNKTYHFTTEDWQADLSTVNTVDATSVEETTATANGLLVDDGGEVCRYRFEYDIDSGVPYALSTTWTGAKTSGQTFSGILSSLTEGELYYFRAQANNSGGIGNGTEKKFLTKPDNPTSFQVARDLLVVQLNLTWTMGDGADRTVIIKKQDSYPVSRADGTVIYNGTAGSYEDGAVTTGNHYFYRAWSYCAEGGLYHYSDLYDEDNKVALEPAVFDVRDITILDSIIPDLMIMVVVENAGGVTADITVGWALTRVDTGGVLDFGSDTFEVTAHTETTRIISPTTSYVGSVDITFTGDGVTASESFPTVRPAIGDGGGIPPLVAPEARDTDGDGLTDKQEEVFGSNPLLPDTDFDGYTDYEEYLAKTDPTDASSYPGVGISIEILLLIVLCIMVSFILFIFVYEKGKKKRTKA